MVVTPTQVVWPIDAAGHARRIVPECRIGVMPRAAIVRFSTILALALAAAGLRLPALATRPMHADEAILADKLGTLLETGRYPYDPADYHGPVLGYLGSIAARLAGRHTYAALTEVVVRAAPAVLGILLALSPLLLAPAIGWTAAVTAAALASVSPALVYYSRDYIPETVLALSTALLLIAVSRRSTGWWALAGVAAGLMIATKETAVLALAATAAAYVAAFRPRRSAWGAIAAFSIALTIAVSLLVAPPWKWGVFGAAAASYAQKGIASGHSHSWYAYIQWIAGFGYSFTDIPILLLGAAGVAAAWRTKFPAPRFLAFFAAFLLLLYSAIPYKTPWCAVTIVYALAVAAGIAVARWRPVWNATWTIAAILLLTAMGVEAWLAALPWSSDPRNPWAYAQTGSGVYSIRDRIEECARAAPEGNNLAIDVYTRENLWPLPWYFRAYPNVRWWRDVSPQGRPASVVLLSPAMEEQVARKLYEGPPPGQRELYMNVFPGSVELRPGIEVRGYIAKSLWDRRPPG
jgi:uncharacterized protein (TIGR03663 family)